MSTVIALHNNEAELHYVVAEDGYIKACDSHAMEPGMSPEAIGQRLAETLAPYSPGSAEIVVALGRNKLQWQHLSLPPCPVDELPELVRLQTDRELNSTADDLGFDFLPLVGDEQTPYEVLTVDLTASNFENIRQIFRAANLTFDRIVPLAAGWPALAKQSSPGIKLGTQIYVALVPNEATLWATRAGRVVLLRQFQLVADDASTSLASSVGSELRRTLLALTQHEHNGQPAISLIGNQPMQLSEVAKTLEGQLELPVQSLDVATQHPALTTKGPSLPLAGLAIDESQGKRPLVDLLHPRRRPQAHINVRTYALAGVAGTLLLALFGWLSYAKLQAPLDLATQGQAELSLLEDSLDNLKTYELRAATIRDWNAEAPNLLLHLERVGKLIRPQSLNSEKFNNDRDVVLEKLSLEKRQLTLDALARNNRAVYPLEARIRDAAYRWQRGKSEPSTVEKEYPWHFKSTIEITTTSDHVESSSQSDSTSETPTEEPQS